MTDGLEDHLHHQAELGREFFWHRLRWRAVQDRLPPAGRRSDGPGDDRGDGGGSLRLLDVGAGTGVLGELLATDRPDATYLFDEPIPSLADRLERRYGAEANHRANPRWDEVDAVTLLDVIEHIDEPRPQLAEICERCRPGTPVLITVPGSERLWSQWDVTLGHRRRYTRRSLRELLATLPVEVDELSWLFPELTPPAAWRAWRNPPRPGTGEDPSAAEFPELPRRVNDLLYQVGRAPVRLRRWMPFGTSLFAATRVTRSGGWIARQDGQSSHQKQEGPR